MHPEVFAFPSALSYRRMEPGTPTMSYSLKKCGRPKQVKAWWEDVNTYAHSRTLQRGYRAWSKNLEETSDILLFHTRAPGVALPHDGVEHGSNFVIPEPSPRRVYLFIAVQI